MMSHSKISPVHVSRNAYVYVRQSTDYQVRHNLESQQRQYELAELAQNYGWQESSIVIIDDDLGRSASSTVGRTGFEKLVTEVALGKAGIVFGLEVSRLARNNRDWYQLLDLCSVKETLIADSDGVYSPADFNDRLLLGLKGTMSEAELHVLKGRMLAGMWHKARKGELQFKLPPGYQFDEMASIVKEHDERIAHLIELVFLKFFEMGSVSGVCKYLWHHDLAFPRRATYDTKPRWIRPYYKAVHGMLTNPMYAGTYVFGKTKVVTDIDEKGTRKSRQKALPMEDWQVVIRDHHPAYISWDDYLRVRKMIEQNRPAAHYQSRASPREGLALLQGLATCGLCGRSMRVHYHSRDKKSYPYYSCHYAKERIGGRPCQSVGGRRIDQAVAQLFLDEMSIAKMDFHLAALCELSERQDATLKQLELDLEKTRYDAERFRRQYDAVEPENRLVARGLETQWNQALECVSRMEFKIRERQARNAKRLTHLDETTIKKLTHNLDQFWASDGLVNKDRKRLLHSVIDEVLLTVKEDRRVGIKVVWKGGAVTQKVVTLPKKSPPRAAPKDLIELIRQLAERHTDAQIARVLIRKNVNTPTGLSYTTHRVAGLRHRHGIAAYRQSNDRSAPAYTAEQAAELFGVSSPTIYTWLANGILKGDQVTEGAPWSIIITEEDRTKLCAQEAPAGWLPLAQAARRFGVTKQTILNWVKCHQVHYVYVTRGRRRGLRIDTNSALYARQESLLPVCPS